MALAFLQVICKILAGLRETLSPLFSSSPAPNEEVCACLHLATWLIAVQTHCLVWLHLFSSEPGPGREDARPDWRKQGILGHCRCKNSKIKIKSKKKKPHPTQVLPPKMDAFEKF